VQRALGQDRFTSTRSCPATFRVQGTVSKKHYESRARTVDDSNTTGDNNLQEKTENTALIFSAEDLSTSHKNCKEVSVIPEKES
jgi:hypothetical protein